MSPAPRARSASIASSRSSKSPPLAADRARSAPRAAAAASIATSRSSSELEAGGHLLAELVHRRVEPGRVEQQRELGGVAVEVALEHRADPADRAVALRLVEQLVDHRAQRAPIAEELLERARQPAVAVGEVGAEGLLERLRRPSSLTVSAWRRSFSNSARTTSTLTVTPASWSASRPIRRARSTRSGRSSAGRSARNAASAGSATTSRSTTIRSPSTRTRVAAGVSGSSRTVSGGRGSAVMVRRCARSVTARLSRRLAWLVPAVRVALSCRGRSSARSRS